jgi:nucleotide-binding universal stress UspA family protein
MMRILVCVDLSKSTSYVVEYATNLARALSARVCLLHATDSQEEMVGYGGVFGEFPVYIDPKELRHDIAQRFHSEHQQVQKLSQQLQEEGLDCLGLLVNGTSIVSTIIKESEKLAAEMIIVGSQHKGLWMQLLEGSTSKEVLNQSSIPVLVIPVQS